ncbi:gamma-butyrobetaine hydroxylase family protein [Endothiovibrio diazotrophicus]
MSDNPKPTEIKLHKQSRTLEIAFDTGERFNMPAEYLRVYSPSAEVRGHGPGQEVQQLGKQDVEITHVEPVGQYAILLRFDDGHDTGIYSWDELHRLGANYEALWNSYLERLEAAGHKRPAAS